MRKIFADIQKTKITEISNMIPVPTISPIGGLAAMRFIMMKGVQGGTQDITVAMVPLGSLGMKTIVPKGTIKISIIGLMKFCASLMVLQILPIPAKRKA